MYNFVMPHVGVSLQVHNIYVDMKAIHLIEVKKREPCQLSSICHQVAYSSTVGLKIVPMGWYAGLTAPGL